MSFASLNESAGTLLTILTPLMAVPLTVITFYLRSLREHQVSWHAELVRRMESVETSTLDLRKTLGEFERYYTTKEEWLRECTHARGTLEQLSEMTIRMETRVQGLSSDPPHRHHGGCDTTCVEPGVQAGALEVAPDDKGTQ